MLDLKTVNSVFERMSSRGAATVALEQNGSDWKPITSEQFYGRVRAVAAKLQTWGIGPGDRVALVSENRWEWAVVDFAVLAIGAVDVPLYATLSPAQMGFILRDAGAKAIFVSNADQYRKLAAAGDIPSIEHVAIFDPADPADFDDSDKYAAVEKFPAILESAPALQVRDASFDALVKAVSPDALATIIYTSGTTGDPKGVMLTHRNLADNLQVSTDGMRLRAGYKSISFLPLSHALARHLDYAIYASEAVIAYLPRFDELPVAMKSVHPDCFTAVPRVFEKVRQAVEFKSTGHKKKIMRWAMRVGRKHRDELLGGKTPSSLGWKLADKLVFSKIRAAFGGQVKFYISGGAPLGMDTANWFLDMGIRIFEGYGLTETSPVVSVNSFDDYRIGSVGRVLPNLKVRLAEDGEIEVSGSAVFSGYWQREQETKSMFNAEGWLLTGDVGKMEDGFLSITDRKKELLKTSGGKYIAPQPIEGRLKADALVGNAALIGNSRQFASVLISPNFPALERWAKEKGVDASDRTRLVKDPKVQQQYEAIVARVNATLEHYETIKKVGVVPDEWNVDSGELTPSMKLKRRVVLEKYKDLIEAFYA